MSMDFSTSISSFNTEFNLNAIKDYNNYLQRQDAFDFETETTDFAKALFRRYVTSLKDCNFSDNSPHRRQRTAL